MITADSRIEEVAAIEIDLSKEMLKTTGITMKQAEDNLTRRSTSITDLVREESETTTTGREIEKVQDVVSHQCVT